MHNINSVIYQMKQIPKKQLVLNTTKDIMSQWTRVVITTVCVCALIMCLLLNIFVVRRHNLAVDRVTYSQIQLIRIQKINELLEIVREMHRLVFSTNFIGTENSLEDSVTKTIASQSLHFKVSEESVIENQNRDNVENLSESVDLNKLLVGQDRTYLLTRHQNNLDQVSKLSKLIQDDNLISSIKKSSSNLTIPNKLLQAANSYASKTLHNPNGFYRLDISFAKSSCNSSLRIKLTRNRFFHDRYVNDIPILIYNAMFSPREYYQRNEYPPPYGWNNITYKDISETIELLQSSVHRRLFDQQLGDKCRRCAVVGNLGSLLNTKFGFKIDSFENVFRANLVATHGFEKYTGTRTTHYFYTFSSLVDATAIANRLSLSFIPTNKDVKFISSDSDEATYKYLHWLLTSQRFGNKSNTDQRRRWPLLPTNKPESFRVVHPDLLRYTSDRWINITNPNSGTLDLELTMLLVALHTCDEVAVFGFGTWEHQQKKKSRKLLKNLSKTELLIQLHKNNIIKLYG